MTQAVSPQTTRSHRRLTQLWILIAICALPSLAAWIFYLNPDWLPEARTNRGQLITPPISVANLQLPTDSGEMVYLRPKKPKWTLFTLAQSPCNEDCRKIVASFRQIQKALAENGELLRRLLVLTVTGEQTQALVRLRKEYPGTQVASAIPEFTSLVTQANNSTGIIDTGHAFIIDPLGRLMMSYAPDATAKDILKDLETLMKASKTWVKGA